MLSQNLQYGLDNSVFFIKSLESDVEVEVFRAVIFSQERKGENEVYTNLDTGDIFKGNMAIQETEESVIFQIKEKSLSLSDFKYITEPLKRVFEASVTTGIPVIWA